MNTHSISNSSKIGGDIDDKENKFASYFEKPSS